jgi:hypothetical protein
VERQRLPRVHRMHPPAPRHRSTTQLMYLPLFASRRTGACTHHSPPTICTPGSSPNSVTLTSDLARDSSLSSQGTVSRTWSRGPSIYRICTDHTRNTDRNNGWMARGTTVPPHHTHRSAATASSMKKRGRSARATVFVSSHT